MGCDLVRLEKVKKVFNRGSVNESTLFEDFSFTIREGEFISVVGSNGSGKTTTLNLICGSLPVDGGHIYLRDQDITKMPEYRRAARIGRVFQDPAKGTCPALTILENMSLADHKGKTFGLSRGVNRRRVDYYRSQLELLHLGLEDKLELPVGVLSGGQRQALALLISTMTPIDLLVLDEHTAALDPKTAKKVLELTDEIIKERELTALMVTHNMKDAIQYGNRLIMMHEGRIIYDVAGEEKKNLQVEDLLKKFGEASGGEFANDRMMLAK